MPTLQLTKHLRLTAELELLTGLRIGGTADKVEIGGLDNPVIKDKNGYPYIPGSSLKGKLRTLLEYNLGKIKDNGDVWSSNDKKDPIIRLFGAGKTEDNPKIGPSRLIFRDATINGEMTRKSLKFQGDLLPFNLLEAKTEVTIDRVTGTGKNPRPMERVVPGVTFNIEIVCRVFDQSDEAPTQLPPSKSDEEMFKEYIPRTLELLEMDCLGGSGSRGYGKVRFNTLELVQIDKGLKTQLGKWDSVAGMRAAMKAA